jgi:RNA polymerase primary sigma factor
MVKESVFADQALQNYLKEIAKFKTLSREEEHELGIKARAGDMDAVNRLVQANLKFVVKIATRYQNRGLSLSELISEGNIGLIKAIEKFDPEKDIKLISYAIWWIKQRIMLAVAEKSSLIRVPVGKSSSAHRIKATQERMFTETGEAPSSEELSEKMNLTEKSIEQLQGHILETTSFDDLVQNDDFSEHSNQDWMHDEDITDPQRLYYRDRIHDKINQAIGTLDRREADIIRTYYGLNSDQETQNFAQIAEKMGLSRERVRQIQKEALRKILAVMRPDEDNLVEEFIEKYNY